MLIARSSQDEYVTYEGLHIPRSPFNVGVIPGCDPTRVRAYGPGMTSHHSHVGMTSYHSHVGMTSHPSHVGMTSHLSHVGSVMTLTHVTTRVNRQIYCTVYCILNNGIVLYQANC